MGVKTAIDNNQLVTSWNSMVDQYNVLIKAYNKTISWLADATQSKKMDEMKEHAKGQEKLSMDKFIVTELICAILRKMGAVEEDLRATPKSTSCPQTFSAVFSADMLNTKHLDTMKVE